MTSKAGAVGWGHREEKIKLLTREYKRFDMGSLCLDSSIFSVCSTNKRPLHTFILCICWCKQDPDIINSILQWNANEIVFTQILTSAPQWLYSPPAKDKTKLTKLL